MDVTCIYCDILNGVFIYRLPHESTLEFLPSNLTLCVGPDHSVWVILQDYTLKLYYKAKKNELLIHVVRL